MDIKNQTTDVQTTVNQRLKFFIDSLNLSPNAFAKEISVSSTAIYKTLDGKSEPGYDLMNRIIKRYPSLNANWLLTGEGEMYISSTPPITESLVNELKKELSWQRALIDRIIGTGSPQLSKFKGRRLAVSPVFFEKGAYSATSKVV